MPFYCPNKGLSHAHLLVLFLRHSWMPYLPAFLQRSQSQERKSKYWLGLVISSTQMFRSVFESRAQARITQTMKKRRFQPLVQGLGYQKRWIPRNQRLSHKIPYLRRVGDTYRRSLPSLDSMTKLLYWEGLWQPRLVLLLSSPVSYMT